MDKTGELIDTLQQRLPIGNTLQSMSLQPFADDLHHVFDKTEVAALGVGLRIGPLKNLHDPNRLLAADQRSKDQQVRGGIGKFLILTKAGLGRYQLRSPCCITLPSKRPCRSASGLFPSVKALSIWM